MKRGMIFKPLRQTNYFCNLKNQKSLSIITACQLYTPKQVHKKLAIRAFTQPVI